MSLALDHLVVAARTLEEGARWLAERLGVEAVPGGRHAAMGTHNALVGLGDGAYLEIIAIDPQAPRPARPRWFGLDTDEMAARLARGPGLVHWVARTDDLETARDRHPALVGEVLALERGDLRWRIGVPADGRLPSGGAFPSLIQWEGETHPSSRIPDAGVRLGRLTVRAPEGLAHGERLLGLGLAPDAPVDFADDDGTGLSAFVVGPRGVVILPEHGPVE